MSCKKAYQRVGEFWFRNRTPLQGVVLSTDRAAMAVSSLVTPELSNA